MSIYKQTYSDLFYHLTKLATAVVDVKMNKEYMCGAKNIVLYIVI